MERKPLSTGELETLHSQVLTQSARARAMVREVVRRAIPITSLDTGSSTTGKSLDAQTALAALAHEILG